MKTQRVETDFKFSAAGDCKVIKIPNITLCIKTFNPIKNHHHHHLPWIRTLARQHSALCVRTNSYRDVFNRFLPESDNLTYSVSSVCHRVKLGADEFLRHELRDAEKGKGEWQKWWGGRRAANKTTGPVSGVTHEADLYFGGTEKPKCARVCFLYHEAKHVKYPRVK